jgi:tetratricopeptide (TPR) repeat protein
MNNAKWRLFLLSGGGIILIVLFLWLPRLPKSVGQKMDSIDPDSARLQSAIQLVEGPNPMEGITILRELIAKDSNNVDAQYYLGLFSVRSGQIDKAMNRFRKVLDLRPDDIRYQIEIGYQLFMLDSTEGAMRCFDRALQLDSTDNNSLFFAAQCMTRLGRNNEAVNFYRQLLRHNSDAVVADKVNLYIDTLINTLP